MTNTQAAHLRERAHRLRRLAEAIESSPAMHLEQLAGDDTWRGAGPALCRDLLQRNLAQLHRAAESLRWHAYVLDQRAIAHDAVPGR